MSSESERGRGAPDLPLGATPDKPLAAATSGVATGKFDVADQADPARTGRFLATPVRTDRGLHGLRFESFQLKRRVGSGGIAEIWLAEHEAIEQEFVVKVARSSLSGNPHVHAQFDREWRATRTLEHPGIVRHHSRGRTDTGRPYLTMDYIPGRTLSWFTRKPVTWPFLRAATLQLCEVLRYSHRHEVLHQDLKPSNILVDYKARRIRLTDFGLARFGKANPNETSRSVLGTPAYMAPEQARGLTGKLGPATDLYTLGVVLYEIATGKKPFDATEDRVVMVLHCTRKVPEIVFRDGVEAPRGLAEVIMRLLEKAPERRFADAAELKRAVAALTF